MPAGMAASDRALVPGLGEKVERRGVGADNPVTVTPGHRFQVRERELRFEVNLGRYLEPRFLVKVMTPLFSWMIQDQAMGALPQIRACVDPAVKSGEYYGPGGRREFKGYPVVVQSNEASHNQADAAQLWEESEELTGVTFHI